MYNNRYANFLNMAIHSLIKIFRYSVVEQCRISLRRPYAQPLEEVTDCLNLLLAGVPAQNCPQFYDLLHYYFMPASQ